jgi:hypothetical protein
LVCVQSDVVCWAHVAYRDKKVVGVFVRFRAPLSSILHIVFFGIDLTNFLNLKSHQLSFELHTY